MQSYIFEIIYFILLHSKFVNYIYFFITKQRAFYPLFCSSVSFRLSLFSSVINQVIIFCISQPNLHSLTILFLSYTICHTSGWKIIIFKWVVKSYFGWMKSFCFFNFGWKFPPKIQKKQQ